MALLSHLDETVVERRARAIAAHQRVMEEAAHVARVAEQTRRLRKTAPVFADPRVVYQARGRVEWTADQLQAARRAS